MRIAPLKNKPVAVIFAGGEGKRLWPVSTKELPKQLNPAFAKKTLVGEVLERVLKMFPREQIVIVTTEVLEQKIRKIAKLPARNWIIQPKNADTGTAMCITALHLQTLFPESTAILFYSDHKVGNLLNFKKAIKEVGKIANEYGSLVTIGTKPTHANTQFGYIKLGKATKEHNLYTVAAFKEKPEESTAKKYLASGKYVWNTGVYAWKTDTLLEALKQVAPDYYQELLNLKIFIGGKKYAQAVREWFNRVKPAPFEKVVSEKLPNMLVYVGGYVWEDVGNWRTVYNLAAKDKKGNVILEKFKGQQVDFIETKNSMVLAKTKHVALVGVKDLIVVETKGGLLICNKDEAGKVKKLAR